MNLSKFAFDRTGSLKTMRQLFIRRLQSRKDKNKPTFSESQPQLERLKAISQWLLAIPIVMLVLFTCGQLGILTSRSIAEANTQSQMGADYAPWSYILIRSVNPEIVGAAIKDRPGGQEVSSLIPDTSQPGENWLESSPVDDRIIPPTSTEDDPAPSSTSPDPGSTSTATRLSPSATATATTLSPTEGSPPAPTSTPSPTPRPTNTQAPSPSSTPTQSSSSEPVTYWMTSANLFGGYRLVKTAPAIAERNGKVYMEFLAEPFAEATSMESGQVTVHFYATNTSAESSRVGFVLSPVIGLPGLGVGNMQIPANTDHPTYFSTTFHTNAFEFSSGNRLSLVITTDMTTQIYWGGDWEAARVIVPPLSN